MRQILLTFCVLFIWATPVLYAQCPEPSGSGSYVFDTQAEVDDLLANYPNCTELAGFVNIAHEAGTSDPITNLNGFINITTIGELVIKETTNLTDLTGLSGLTQVNSGISILDNIALTSLNGIENLTAIGANSPFTMLTIAGNTALTDITAFQNVNSGFIHWTLIDGNPSLTSLEGMDNMVFDPLMFDFQITNNPNLSVCAVEKICEYITSGGAATINGNAPGCETIGEVTTNCQINYPSCPENDVTLTTQAEVDQFLVDYPFCAIIPGMLTINDAGTDPITNLDGLQNIQTIYGLTIQNTTLTDFSGLDALETINGNVVIDNISGNNINFLSGFTMIEGNLVIQNNTALTNLTALNTLTHLDGSLEIKNNDALTTLSGLDNIIANTISNLVIENNDNLSACNMNAVCIYLANDWPATISGNDTGCDTISEVEGTCNIAECPPGDVEFNSQAELDYFILQYPNCTQLNGAVTIYGAVSQDITNLNALQNITHVEGILDIKYTEITNFEGLNNLETTGSHLSILYNDYLIDFQGMDNLNFIGGNFEVFNNDSLQSFHGLESLTSIYEGISVVYNPLIVNFNGLNNLTEIGISPPGDGIMPDLSRIFRNNSLTSLDGLENLTTFHSGLELLDNPMLSSISALSGITQIATGIGWDTVLVRIQELPSLETLEGLHNLEIIYGDLKIISNPSLANLEALSNLSGIIHLAIENNDALVTLNGLQGFTKIGLAHEQPYGSIDINSNDALISLEGLNNLHTINQGFSVTENENLISLNGLNNLEILGTGLAVGLNPSLVNLDALNNLTSLGTFTSQIYSLAIGQNASLTSIEGLMNLTEFTPERLALYIEGNPILESLSGLDNIPSEAFYHVSLQWNPELSHCSVPSICGFIATNPTPDHFRVSENTTGCATPEEVIDICGDMGTEDLIAQENITLYPVPVKEWLNIEKSASVKVKSIEIYSMAGELVMSSKLSLDKINVGSLSAGTYTVVITTEKSVVTKKIIKK